MKEMCFQKQESLFPTPERKLSPPCLHLPRRGYTSHPGNGFGLGFTLTQDKQVGHEG